MFIILPLSAVNMSHGSIVVMNKKKARTITIIVVLL